MGNIPAQQSFFSTKEGNVVITAVKQAADGSGTIVRFYEWAGKKGDVHLALPQKATAASQTNLMEQPEGALTLGNGGSEITVPTEAYEIKTVKLAFK